MRRKVREFLFGMTGYEFAREALEMRATLETIFMVVTVGDMVGVPVMLTHRHGVGAWRASASSPRSTGSTCTAFEALETGGAADG
jgi:hypothetical protein